MPRKKPREIALDLLEARERGGPFIEQALDRELERAELKSEDRRFLQELVYGVIRWQLTLDWLIAQKSGDNRQKSAVQNLLRLALYQMFWLERVPGYAAVNESVEICKQRGLLGQAKFVNAVLRGCGREADKIRAKLAELRETNLALGYSHPEWLCRRWAQRWGKAKTVELLEWNNSPPPLFARVNGLKTGSADLLKRWTGEGVEFRESSFDWIPPGTVFQLVRHPALTKLGTFQEGLFYIQDPSTLLAARMLAPEPGETILDICAAPGGKTTYLAQLISNQGQILAQDLDPERLKLVQENCARLGSSCVTIEPSAFATLFDRVLVDASCSNTGVMRRRIELRWRIKPEEILRLATVQLELLEKAAARTKSGGTLVYSTCSLEPEENEKVVREFLASSPDFQLEQERELIPMHDRVDGAYCALLRRRSGSAGLPVGFSTPSL